MKAQEQMEYIVEKSGECWHERNSDFDHTCYKCGEHIGPFGVKINNPSPHDLNELVRLVDKLKYNIRIESVFVDFGVLEYQIHLRKHGRSVWSRYAGEQTATEAIRNALIVALK